MESATDGSVQRTAELNERQKKLLAALAENPEISAAAQAAGVGRTTAHRWLKEEAFSKALADQQNAALKNALGSVKGHAARAANEMMKLLDSGNEWLRRQICKDILSYALRIREQEELEQRLEAVEQALKTAETEGWVRR